MSVSLKWRMDLAFGRLEVFTERPNEVAMALLVAFGANPFVISGF